MVSLFKKKIMFFPRKSLYSSDRPYLGPEYSAFKVNCTCFQILECCEVAAFKSPALLNAWGLR